MMVLLEAEELLLKMMEAEDLLSLKMMVLLEAEELLLKMMVLSEKKLLMKIE